MKILVIGGSYFFGRIFVYAARKEHDVTVVNRGRRPLGLDDVKEIRADRQDPAQLAALKEECDVIVDFCGFAPGDIRKVAEAEKGLFKQYIFVSTVDALRRNVPGDGSPAQNAPGDGSPAQKVLKDENAPYETRDFGGRTGTYILGKAALEKELKACAEADSFAYTVVRPAIIYGPYNYAPREQYYVRQILAGEPVYEPVLKSDPGDGSAVCADGEFQFVSVRDAAHMILALCGRESAFGETYHLAAPERITYRKFFSVLESMHFPGTDIRRIPYEEASNVHFPFPVTAQETELYSGDKIVAETGISYTDFETGMRETLQMMYGYLKG